MTSHGDTRIHRTLGVLLFSILLFASVASGQTVLDSITVNPTSVDVSGGYKTVDVTMHMRNSSGGVFMVFVYFGDPATSSMIGMGTLVAGDSTNGTWTAQMNVMPSTPPGTYPVVLQVYDMGFNLQTINTPKSVQVSGGDSQAPTLSGTPVVTPSSVDVSGGPQTVTVDFDLQDNASGVIYANAAFRKGDTLSVTSSSALLVSGDALNGSYRATVEIPQWANGPLTLRISAMDNAYNSLDTTIGIALTVTGGDTVLPSVTGTPVAEPLAVNVGSGDKVGKVTLTATDTYTGIADVYLSFADGSGHHTGNSSGATLVSGDSLNGVWELDTYFSVDDSAGTYHLFVSLTDVAGNSSETEFPGVTVTVTRAPEAWVTFRMDSRRLERLGLLLRDRESPQVRIFGGMNDGEYTLFNSGADSVWADSVVVQVGQTITYAFGIPGPGGSVYELGGGAGGRSLPIPSTAPLVLPVVAYDNLPPVSVDPAHDAVVKYGFSAGDPYVHEFTDGAARTYASIDFPPLGADLVASVRRYSHSGGGAAPGGIAVVAPDLYWGFASAPAGVSFSAKLIFAYDFFGGVADPSALRLLRRADSGQPWTVVATSVNTDNGTLEAAGVTSFGEWTIGSTSASNTLVPAAPGAAGNPNPADSTLGVGTWPTLSWMPAPNAYSYDLYLWPSSGPVPPAPTRAGLTSTSYGVSSHLGYNVAYSWKVVARNLVGATSSPVWTFSTVAVPDLIVSDVRVPPESFSGQAVEIGWTVTNTGSVGTTSPAWRDAFYLSIDSVLIPRGDIYLGEAQNPASLGPGESYAASKTFIIPDSLFGVYRLIVVTDYFTYQTESDEANNQFVRDIPITLTPPPDLRVDVVSAPASGFSGQNVPVLYTVKNYGTNATTSAQWYDGVYLSPDSLFNPATAVRLGAVHRTQALFPDSSYTASLNVRLPDTVYGPKYLFVFADYTNLVHEFGLEDNNTRHAAIDIALSPPPDLVVTSLTAPPAGGSGQHVALGWTVQNQGSAGVFSSWSDRVMVGKNPVFNPDSVTVLGTFSNVKGLARDSSYTRLADVVLPNGITGPWYFFVETDWKQQVFEYTFESNNVLRAPGATAVSLSPWPDLRVASISAPGNATANDVFAVTWSVENAGSGAVGVAAWTDSLYVSPSATFDSSTAVVLTGVSRSGGLDASASYSATAGVRLPAGLAEGDYYIHVVTDRNNTVYEHTGEGNNGGVSGGINVSAYPPVDLTVASLSVGPAGSSGTPFPIEYTVTNTGGGATLAGAWADVVYLSSDTALDYGSDIRLARIDRSSPLAAGESYTRTLSPVLPDGVSGDYYVIVRSDSASAVNDANPADNARSSAAPVTIALSPTPDFRVTELAVPPSGSAGQPVVVSWTVSNFGAEAGPGRAWFDGIYLSADAAASGDDIRLGTVERTGPLAGAGSYSDTLELVLPDYASGTYYLLVKADSRNDVYEHNAEGNNTAASIITVSLPPPADLVVGPIVVPPSSIVGEDVTIEWTVRNQGVNPATGRMTDAVYFSADSTWDISDLLLGEVTREIDLAPGTSSKALLRANLAAAALADSSASVADETPGLFPGGYFVLVRTDVRNNIRESDNANNTGSSSSTVDVNVPLLSVGVEDTGSISSGSPRHYRVEAPANLDLRITATSSIGYPSIDLFTAFDRMPTGNSYDQRTADPGTLNREVLVPSTQAGTYYLMMRSIINPGRYVSETYTVLAETLGFSVEQVSPDNGGSGGYVTGSIRGAGFRPTSKIYLMNGATQAAEARIREFHSTMEMTVQWDLRGVPLGTYDVEVMNEGGATARLAAAFKVETMRDPVISVGKTVPRLLLVGRKEAYSFRFTNTSNVDIPYFFVLVAVPDTTEISVELDSDRLLTRSRLVPDSLVPEGERVDDWIDGQAARFVPIIGRDLPPGEAYGCRVSFRNPAYLSGMNFPMYVSTKSMTKELFLEIQLGQIEQYRAEILRQSAGADPEYVARAGDPTAFAHYALSAYVPMGLLDPEDIPGVGLEQIAAAATGFWKSPAARYAPMAVPRLQMPQAAPDPLCEAFFNIIACPAAIIDCFIDIPFIPPPVSLGLCVFGVATSCLGVDAGPLNYVGCFGVASILTCLGKEYLCKLVASSYDPNDITGPDGAGDERWVAKQQTLPYTIRFENDSLKAVVPARRVTVTQQLDTTADLRSVRLGSFGFGAHVFQAPGNVATYTDRLDLRDPMGIFVDVTAGIDVANGRISWTFNSVDPATGGAPADPFAGFLPVNDSLGSGQGFVSYTVRPGTASKTRDTIHAEATIVFDINDPINTPAIFNVVDAAAPASSVRALEPAIDLASFPVHWGGADDPAGSGIKRYSVYYSLNGAPYTAWLADVTDTIAVFAAPDTGQYAFFSIATDVAGNVEPLKTTPDATTTVITGVAAEEDPLPKTFALAQNYPNPFNPTTMIRYDVPAAAWVRLSVFNVLGQEVATLVNAQEGPGRKMVEWASVNRHGFSLPSGVYFYRMEATGTADASMKFLNVKKMMLLR